VKSKSILACLMVLSGSMASAQSKLSKEVSDLGANKSLKERVQNLDSAQRTRIVQNRTVDRNLRLELGLSAGRLSGGDSYLQTENASGYLEFHFTPRWSVGIRHSKYFNKLTDEGRQVYDRAWALQQADAGDTSSFSGVDYMKESTQGSISFYPIYGKLNVFDASVVHFDVYTTLRAGQLKLQSGSTNIYAGGVGTGVWLNQLFSFRIEALFQSYRDFVDQENRSQQGLIAQAAVGILL
jgi:outer membrane immunogenic protein